MSVRETIYCERANRQWEHWTYVDGIKYRIGKRQYDLMASQGAKIVFVK